MGTKSAPEHEWLQQLVGEWRIDSEMETGPDEPKLTFGGTETVQSLGDLWAYGETKTTMPNGKPMTQYTALGYDVSFKEYRGCRFASVSSHLWKQVGELSADGRVMTLSCVGPDLTKDEGTANYRDVIEIVDENHRTLTSLGQNDNGEWQQFVKSTYTRI